MARVFTMEKQDGLEMQIKFIALISRDNQPVCIETCLGNDNDNGNGNGDGSDCLNEELKYNFLSHMALDALECAESPTTTTTTTTSTPAGAGSTSPRTMPALLFIEDGVSVYGNVSAAGFKVVIGATNTTCTGTTSSSHLRRLSDAAARARRVYIDWASNPFSLYEPTEGAVLSEKLRAIIREC